MDTCAIKVPKGRIVFQLMEAIGHINLSLPIAAELQERGYKVILLTTRPLAMAQKLKAQGFELDYCVDPPKDEAVEDKRAGGATEIKRMLKPLIERFRLGAKRSFQATYQMDGACGKYLLDTMANHDAIEAKLKSLNPDIIVVDQVVGVPCVTQIAPKWIRMYSGFPSVLYSSYNENFVAGLGLKLDEMTPEQKRFEIETKSIIREKLRQFWLEKKGDDWSDPIDIAPTSPFLNFYFGPKELGLENIESLKPLPDCWVRLEHSIRLDKGGKKFEIPEKIVNHPGKLIYFSLGTLVNSDTELLNRLLTFFSKSRNKFIVSTGQMDDSVKLYENMWGESYVDQNAILSTADLFITHGGHNSIMEAFYHGVGALIVLPVFADQFDSAQRIEDCGFGRRLNPYECSESEILGCIEELLADEETRNRMQSIGKRLQSVRYYEKAADRIEALLSE